jgi:hypothetical protein
VNMGAPESDFEACSEGLEFHILLSFYVCETDSDNIFVCVCGGH